MSDRALLLATYSEASLRAELARRRRLLTRLKAQRERLLLKLKLVDERLAAEGFRARRHNINTLTLPAVIESVLRDGPLPIPTIVQRVLQSGYQTLSLKFRSIVTLALLQHPKRFKRVTRGVYELARGASAS